MNDVFAYWAPRILREDERSALRARRHREVWRWVVVRKLKTSLRHRFFRLSQLAPVGDALADQALEKER